MYLSAYYKDNSLGYICEKCNNLNPINCNKEPIFKFLSEDCCILNDGEKLTCQRCGNIHDSINPLLKNESEQQSSSPKCPVCNSFNINKISITNKVGSVAMFGLFATGHISKTFKCGNCGMKF